MLQYGASVVPTRFEPQVIDFQCAARRRGCGPHGNGEETVMIAPAWGALAGACHHRPRHRPCALARFGHAHGPAFARTLRRLSQRDLLGPAAGNGGTVRTGRGAAAAGAHARCAAGAVLAGVPPRLAAAIPAADLPHAASAAGGTGALPGAGGAGPRRLPLPGGVQLSPATPAHAGSRHSIRR